MFGSWIFSIIRASGGHGTASRSRLLDPLRRALRRVTSIRHASVSRSQLSDPLRRPPSIVSSTPSGCVSRSQLSDPLRRQYRRRRYHTVDNLRQPIPALRPTATSAMGEGRILYTNSVSRSQLSDPLRPTFLRCGFQCLVASADPGSRTHCDSPSRKPLSAKPMQRTSRAVHMRRG